MSIMGESLIPFVTGHGFKSSNISSEHEMICIDRDTHTCRIGRNPCGSEDPISRYFKGIIRIFVRQERRADQLCERVMLVAKEREKDELCVYTHCEVASKK